MVLETKKLGLVPISHLVHCDNLFQNVTYITAKCDSYIIKCVKRLLQNESVTLLQNVTGIIKHDNCVTRYDVYYIQNAWVRISSHQENVSKELMSALLLTKIEELDFKTENVININI